METPYEGYQQYGPLRLNKFAVHEMKRVDEGNIVCVRNEPDRFGAATPHYFALVLKVRCGVDGKVHSVKATVALLDGSPEKELSQDIWIERPGSQGLARFRALSVVRIRARVTMEVPVEVMHFNQKLATYKRVGNDTRAEAVRENRDLLDQQLSLAMQWATDVENFCEENYGVRFRVTMNPFVLTVRRVSYAGGSGWIAVSRDRGRQPLDGESPPRWRVLNGGRLVAETEEDFPPNFQAYLPWREGQQVTFDECFLDGGPRVTFAMRTHDGDWLRKFEAHALVELEVGPDGKYRFPNLPATSAPFSAWRANPGRHWSCRRSECATNEAGAVICIDDSCQDSCTTCQTCGTFSNWVARRRCSALAPTRSGGRRGEQMSR